MTSSAQPLDYDDKRLVLFGFGDFHQHGVAVIANDLRALDGDQGARLQGLISGADPKRGEQAARAVAGNLDVALEISRQVIPIHIHPIQPGNEKSAPFLERSISTLIECL